MLELKLTNVYSRLFDTLSQVLMWISLGFPLVIVLEWIVSVIPASRMESWSSILQSYPLICWAMRTKSFLTLRRWGGLSLRWSEMVRVVFDLQVAQALTQSGIQGISDDIMSKAIRRTAGLRQSLVFQVSWNRLSYFMLETVSHRVGHDLLVWRIRDLARENVRQGIAES